MRVQRPSPVLRTLIKSRQRLHEGMLYHWYWHQRPESNAEGLGPLSWTVTTHTTQIDHSYQICCPTGLEANNCTHARLIASKGALKKLTPIISASKQRAKSNAEGLGPLRWAVTTLRAQFDHSYQICYPTGQEANNCAHARLIASKSALRYPIPLMSVSKEQQE
jgi:hypothetical protein